MGLRRQRMFPMTSNRIFALIDALTALPFAQARRLRRTRRQTGRSLASLPQGLRDDLDWPHRATLDDGRVAPSRRNDKKL